MRTWARADRDMLCGLCPDVHIAVGDPVLLITLQDGAVTKVRCKHCAGPVPPDLPERIEVRPIPAPFVPVRFTPDMLPLTFKSRAVVDALAASPTARREPLAFDFKARGAGEREPGEEG